MKTQKAITVCATGHRPSQLPRDYGYDYRNARWSSIIADTKEIIKSLDAHRAITGMAQGFDTAFAIAVLQLQNEGYKITLEAAIPCKTQADAWTDNAKKLYKAILARCEKTYCLSDTYTQDCMRNRNAFMVDNSDIVIAMFDPDISKSGTYQTVRYAHNLGKKVYNVYDILQKLSANKVLYCDSKGDKRFSALCAKVTLDGVEDTIENFYQNSKRDENDKVPGKGRKVSYMMFRGKKLPASKLSDFYRYLWKLYFQQNPKLLEYASQFNTFIDRFRGRCINCQADVIRDLVNEYRNTEPTSTKSEPNVGSLKSRKGDKCMEKLDLSSLEVGAEKKIHILDLLNQEEEREEAYFLQEEERSRNANSFELYITQDPRKGFLDIDLFTNLYNFCIKAIKSRLVMILDLEKVISSLVNIEEYTYGFKENPTVTQAESLKAFYRDIKVKLSDKKVKEFIKVNNDYTVFGCDDATRCDYITTYQKVIRLLTNTCGESLEFYRDVINNVKDELQSIILDNTYEVETISLVENEESEDSLEYAY